MQQLNPFTRSPGAKTSALPIEVVPPTRHTQDVNSVVFSKDDENRFVASSGDDGVVKLWDVLTGRLIRNIVRIDPNNKYWRVKALSSDGRRLLGVVADEIKLWDTITGKEIMSVSDLVDNNSVVMSKDGARLATLRADRALKVFDGNTGKELTTLKNVVGLALTDDGRPVATVSPDKTIELWTDQTVKVDQESSDEVSDSGSHLYVEGDGSTLRLRDLESRRELRTFLGQDPLNASKFSADGSRVAISLPDKISILDAETGQRVGACPRPSVGVAAFAFSSDTHQLLYGGADKAVTLCDPESGTIVRSYVGHAAAVKSVSFSSNNPQLASGDDDGAVKLWDTTNGKVIRNLKGNERAALVVAFSPDGRKG